MRQLTRSGIAAATLAIIPANAQAETAADAYKAYVDQMIPETFAIAKANAEFNERLIFSNKLSDLQSAYSLASDASLLFERLLPLFPANAAQASCPVGTTTEVDVGESLRQLMLVVEVGNARMEVANRLALANQIMDTLPKACARGFEEYNIDKLKIAIARESIEAIDGTYLAADLTGNPYVLAASFLFSMFQVLANADEERQIDEQSARFQRDSAKSSDYASFASAACASYMPEFSLMFDDFKPIRISLESVLAKVPAEMLVRAEDRLTVCVESSQQDVVNQLKGGIVDSVRRAIAAQGQPGYEGLSIQVNIKSQQAEARLKSVPCGEGASLVDDVNGYLSTMHLYHLSGYVTVYPRLKGSLERRASHCGGRHL